MRAALAREDGQGTLEFAVVTFAFLAIALGMAALAAYLADGALVDAASAGASHAIDASQQAIRDVLLY